MPRKKNAAKTASATAKTNVPNKSAFIRQHSTLKAAEIVAKGKEAGLTFDVSYVYSVRQNAKAAKKKGGGGAKKMGRPAGSKNKSGHSGGGAVHHVDQHGHLKAIRSAIVHLGAHTVLATVQKITKELGG